MEVTEGRIEANGLLFAYLAAGPADGPLALCLHGFPDSAWTWRHLLPELAGAGYRAVAPFMRGYAPTEVAEDGRYFIGDLIADSSALHEALGGDDSAVLIGHDWGAAAGYPAAAFAPDRWRRLVTMAVPPPGAFATALLTNYEQLKRSWYFFFFQSPLADMVVANDDLAFIDRIWADWSPGFAAAEDLEYTKQSLRDPANLAAAIGYYRANMGGVPPDDIAAEQAAASASPAVPTLYLHGAADGCSGVELAAGVDAVLPPESAVEIVDGAGHFLHLERPEEVNGHVVKFLSR